MPFEIADDPGTDYRELVRAAYEPAYAGQRSPRPAPSWTGSPGA